MHSLVPLLVAAAAVCAIARPPGPSEAFPAPHQLSGPAPSARGILHDYYLPRLLMTQYLDYDSPVVQQQLKDDWLNKEIDRINQMEEDESLGAYEKDLARIVSQDPYLVRMFENPTRFRSGPYSQETGVLSFPAPQSADISPKPKINTKPKKAKKADRPDSQNDKRKNFALTPLDKGYFDTVTTHKVPPITKTVAGHQEGGGPTAVRLQPARQIRQNPNLSKTKHLVAENLDQLRSGLSHEDSGTTEKPHSIRILEAATVDPADSIYGIAIMAAVGTALVLAIIGFAFGWYTMTKRAKAAADVDYPAYGVTGPTMDMTGDRKLAHSAHMYHYQHQKQQIIAMERNGMEQRNGSISEPESEEDNEEGDYTVYECPGFATTGDMEVKNPLFSEEPTPATPGKCELVKPQPKE